MSEQMMAELLDRVVPVELGRPDWDDVRARANLRDQRDARPQRRTFRRPRYIVLAAALALAVLLVTPAFGVRDLLVDLVTREDQDFGGASIAPTVVQRNFHEMTAGAPEGMDPQVLPLQTRLVAQIRYEGRERNLWVAPTARGGFCFQIGTATAAANETVATCHQSRRPCRLQEARKRDDRDQERRRAKSPILGSRRSWSSSAMASACR